MQTRETFTIILVEPIASEDELLAAQEALEMLREAEPGSENESKRSRIAGMVREYEQRSVEALRNAGEASAEWTSDHKSGLGWIAGGAASIAAATFGLIRWRKAKRPQTVRDRIGSFADRSTKSIGKAGKKAGKAGKSGWKGARSRVKSLK